MYDNNKGKVNNCQTIFLDMTKIGEVNVTCREPIKENLNYGVIGPVPCPPISEQKDRKIQRYKEALQSTGTPINDMSWITKMETDGGNPTIKTTNYI